MQGHAEVLQLLLDRGALITDRDNCQRTPLALAAGSGYADCVGLLIKAGARITKEIPGDEICTETRGRTPLLLAAARGHREVCLCLPEISQEHTSGGRSFLSRSLPPYRNRRQVYACP